MTFKVGDRVRHTEEGFTGTVVRDTGAGALIECDFPYVSKYAHSHNRYTPNGYNANNNYLCPEQSISMQDALDEYEAIIAAQEAMGG